MFMYEYHSCSSCSYSGKIIHFMNHNRINKKKLNLAAAATLSAGIRFQSDNDLYKLVTSKAK